VRLEIERGLFTLTLSRRNVLALLHKLDWPISAKRLRSANAYIDGRPTEIVFVVRVVDDDRHYLGRSEPAGPMHPETERFIASTHGAGRACPIKAANAPEHEG
jgi:hypothetical protein